MSISKVSTIRPAPLYYFAYGSNLNVRQMLARCPGAEPIARCFLPDYRLIFDGVADIVPTRGHSVQGAIYKITRRCEAALDRYEGFPTLYYKDYFAAEVRLGKASKVHDIMYYTMGSESCRKPSQGYVDTIREGFDDWRLDQSYLDAAVDEARQGTAQSSIGGRAARRA